MAHLDCGNNLNFYLSFPKMIEPELAFADLEDDMACATAYLQYVVGYLANLLSIYGFIDILSLMLCVSNIDLISNFA